MTLDLANPVIPRRKLTLLSSSPQEEHNLALEATTPAIPTLSPEPLARPTSAITLQKTMSPQSMETVATVAGLVTSMASPEIRTSFLTGVSVELPETQYIDQYDDDQDTGVSDLFNGTMKDVNMDIKIAESLRADMAEGNKPRHLDPLPLDIISQGRPVKGHGQVTVGPISSDVSQ